MSEIPPPFIAPAISTFLSLPASPPLSPSRCRSGGGSGWQIYDMERTPLALGLVGLCQFAPMFLLTLPAGDSPTASTSAGVYSLAAGCRRCAAPCSWA